MKDRILTKNFCCTFMSQFSLALVMYMLMTTITEYTTSFGATATIGGMVSGIYIFGGLFSRIYSGKLMGKIGWKRVALIFLVLHFVACVCYFISGSSILLLLIIRFIHGLGFGASANAVMVIGMSSLPVSRYGEATGYFMLSTSLGVAVGPFVGGVIYDAFGGNGSFVAASILSLMALIFIILADTKDIDPYFRSREGEKSPKTSHKETSLGVARFIEKKALPVAMCMLFVSVGYAALISFYRLYAESLDMKKEFSYFFIIYAVILLISRPVAGILQDRLGDNAVCYPCMLFQVLGLFLIAFKPCMLTIIICAVGSALGYGTLNSVFNVIANKNVSNERRSYAVATYWAACDMGVGLSPILLGAVITAIGYTSMYYAAAAASFIAIPLYWLFVGRKNRRT